MRVNSGLATLSLLFAVAAPLRAQLAAGDSLSVPRDTAMASVPSAPEPRAAAAAVGAPLTGLRSGIHARETARVLQPAAVKATNANLGQSKALMLVGAAALITGAIIGGDPGTIIMVGGAVIGLYGLYQYLQ